METIKPLNIADITHFNDDLKNKLFDFASAKLEYDEIRSNGVIKPLIALFAVIAVMVLDKLAFPSSNNSEHIQSVVNFSMPWIVKIGFCLLTLMVVLNFVRYKPYQLRARKSQIAEMIDYFSKAYNLNVKTVKTDELWIEVIKQSKGIEEEFTKNELKN